MKSLFAAIFAVLCMTAPLRAAPVWFDIVLNAGSSGSGGSGSFAIDSADIASVPGTGTQFGADFVTDFSVTVAGVVYDTFASANVGFNDGVLTGICCSTFTSSGTAGAQLTFNSSGGFPSSWQANGLNGIFEGYNSGRTSYEISPSSAAVVPLPASAVLLIGSLGGLAALRRRKRAA